MGRFSDRAFWRTDSSVSEHFGKKKKAFRRQMRLEIHVSLERFGNERISDRRLCVHDISTEGFEIRVLLRYFSNMIFLRIFFYKT